MKLFFTLSFMLSFSLYGIIGGEITERHAPVKKIMYLIKTPKTTYRHKCMATRVSSKYLLSAGHCFLGLLKHFKKNGVCEEEFEEALLKNRITIYMNDEEQGKQAGIIFNPEYLNMMRYSLDKSSELTVTSGLVDMALVKLVDSTQEYYPVNFEESFQGERITFIGKDSSKKTLKRIKASNQLEKPREDMYIVKGRAELGFREYEASADVGDSGTSLLVKNGDRYQVIGVLNRVNKYSYNQRKKRYIFSLFSQTVHQSNKDFLKKYLN